MLRVVGVDNGGSGLRVNNANGNLLTFDSDFVSIQPQDFRKKDCEDELGVIEIVRAPHEEYLGLVARGNAGRLYESTALSFNSQGDKTSSIPWYRIFIYGLAVDAYYGKFGLDGTERPLARESTDFEYVIATVIPVKEHGGKTDKAAILRDMLEGTYEVYFPLCDKYVTFSIRRDYVGVLPEGGVAVAALRSELGSNDISLIIDIGHVSMEIMLFKGTKLCSNKVVTSSSAGSTLCALVQSAFSDEGYRLNEEQVREVISTKCVNVGNACRDVSAIVEKCEAEFVQNFIQEEINSVLLMNKINVRQVNNVIPIGACFEDKDETILREIMHTCGLGSAKVRYLAESPRLVNVICATIYANLLARGK